MDNNSHGIPENATIEEHQALMFTTLYGLNVNDKVEKKDNLTYLSWAYAWAEFKKVYPSATYRVITNPDTHLPYFSDPDLGIVVMTEVIADNLTYQMWLPVMDSKNKAMKLQPYTYQIWDSYKKTYIDKTVAAASMFDINKTLMRCLVKNLAMFGLGLYIYAGEDLPESDAGNAGPASNQQPQMPASINPPVVQASQHDYSEEIRIELNKVSEMSQLVSILNKYRPQFDSNRSLQDLYLQIQAKLVARVK